MSMVTAQKFKRVEFLSSIILGLNDALIELTGALTGFAFAFQSNLTVATAGLILGVAAALSMASSAYMQARYEEGKDPAKAAIYTGVSYITVVLSLVLPFFIFRDILFALFVMFGVVLFIVFGLSYYTSVIFKRSFQKNLLEIFTFSVGVAGVSFVIGLVARSLYPLA